MTAEWWARDFDGTAQVGPYRTRRDVVTHLTECAGTSVLERHAYGDRGGDYEYALGYPGEDDWHPRSTWFVFDRNRAPDMWIEPAEVARRHKERYGT